MEIEVKARVTDMPVLKGKLEALGCVFSSAIVQDDTVFVQKTGSLEEFLSNDAFLRVRIQNDGKVILTAKKATNRSAENLVKTEYEVSVSSADEIRSILELAGFTGTARLKKTRQKSHHGSYEICLDEIEGLGSFIELEQIAEERIAATIQEEMFAFLETLGIVAGDQVKKGYDILMLEKQAGAQA